MIVFGLSRISETLLTGAAMLYRRPRFISRRVSVTGEAGCSWRVSVAGSHGPAKPAFCRYRQRKLVIYSHTYETIGARGIAGLELIGSMGSLGTLLATFQPHQKISVLLFCVVKGWQVSNMNGTPSIQIGIRETRLSVMENAVGCLYYS